MTCLILVQLSTECCKDALYNIGVAQKTIVTHPYSIWTYFYFKRSHVIYIKSM